jgi:hypothetical protein
VPVLVLSLVSDLLPHGTPQDGFKLIHVQDVFGVFSAHWRDVTIHVNVLAPAKRQHTTRVSTRLDT